MKKITTIITSISSLILSASPVMAQVDLSISKPPNLKIDNPSKLLGGVVGLVLIIAALAAFIYLIWGGVEWITSGGDKAGVENAQHKIQAALLGLFIVFAAWAIMLVAGQFLGFDISNLKIPTPF